MANDRNPQLARPQAASPIRQPAPNVLGPVVESLGQMAELAVGFRQEQINTELQGELLAEQEQALAAQEFASQEVGATPRDPREMKTLQEFQAAMDDLDAAANQGSGSITQLKIRQERILRDYMARYPKLSAQFNQSATGVLGYSPLGAEVRAMEAAEARAGRSSMGALTSFYMQRANELGVDTTLYLTNPEKFWTELQSKSIRRSRIEDITLWGKEWQNFDSTEWQLGVANMAVEFWDKPDGINAMIDTALQMAGYPGSHVELKQALAESSASGGANTIEELLPLGVYERFRAEIEQNKTKALQDLYATFVNEQGTVVNGRRIAPLTMEQFAEKVQPILTQFDFAATFAGNEYAINSMKRFNELRAEGALADLPDYLVRYQVVQNALGPNTTVGQMFAKGLVADMTADMTLGFLGVLGLSPSGEITDPNGAPTPVFDAEGRTGRKPPKGAARFRTVRELKLNAPEALEEYDEAFQQLLGDVTTSWLDYGVQQQDPMISAIAVHTIIGYGKMVNEAKRPGIPNNLRPTAETDDMFLAAIANPNFAEAYRIAYPQAGAPMESPEFQQAWAIAHERIHETVGAEIARVKDIIINPAGSYAALEHDFFRTLSSVGVRGMPAAPDVAPKPDPDFVGTMFANNYVQFNLDKEARTMSYSMHPSTPKAFREYGQFVVDMLNDSSEADRRRLAMYGLATENLTGVPAAGAMRRVLLGME